MVKKKICNYGISRGNYVNSETGRSNNTSHVKLGNLQQLVPYFASSSTIDG